MFKKNFFFIVILLFAFASIIYFNGNIPQTKIANEQNKDNLDNLNIPKCSAVKVKSIQNFTVPNSINAVSISADGNYIAIGAENLTLFNKTSPNKMWNFDPEASIVNVVISANGSYIAGNTMSPSNRVMFFNKTYSHNKKSMWNYTSPESGAGADISSISISADGKYLVVGSWNYNVSLFDNKYSMNKKPIWSYNTTELVVSAAISADGNYVVAGHNTNMTLLNRSDGTLIWSYNTTNNVKTVDISMDGRYIVIAHGSNITYLDSVTKTPLWKYDHPDNYATSSAKISADGKYIIAIADGGFKVVTSVSGFLDNSLEVPKTARWDYGSSIRDIAISLDGNYGLVGHSTNILGLLDKASSASKEALWEYTTENTINSIAISGIGNYFVAGCDDAKAYLFYYDVPIPRIPLILGDDDDDDEETAAIPFGNYFLLFIIISIISLILIHRQKVFFSKK